MSDEYKRQQSFPLRLSPSMRRQADNLAEHEGISLNHFISLAVAEKISRMEESLNAGDGAGRKEEKPVFNRSTSDR